MDIDLVPDFEAQCRAERSEDKPWPEYSIKVTVTKIYKVNCSAQDEDTAIDDAIKHVTCPTYTKRPEKVDCDAEILEAYQP